MAEAVLPKSIDVSSVGEGKTIFIDPRAHPAYNFWSQVTDPTVRQLQLILAPEEPPHMHTRKQHTHMGFNFKDIFNSSLLVLAPS